MALYDALFRSDQIAQLFSPENLIQDMLRFEQALALAQAEEGVIPTSAAQRIAANCSVDHIDVALVKAALPEGGNAAIPVIKQLTQHVHRMDAEAAKYIHRGATSQDVIDTAMVLRLNEIQGILDHQLTLLIRSLQQIGQQYVATPMMGRTLLQQARPITFGLKVALWRSGLQRTLHHLRSGQSDWLQLQWGGAVGGGNDYLSPAIQQRVANKLGLQLAPTWHTQRDGLLRWANELGILSGQLGKIAKDISLLAQTEIGEVAEGSPGGSSTMPNKQNPVLCGVILANSARVPGLMSTLYSGMIQEHERALGAWHAEWETLETLTQCTLGSLKKSQQLFESLRVFPEKMQENIDRSGGFWHAETVALALAEIMGKQEAHDWVKKACEEALKKRISFLDYLNQSEKAALFDWNNLLDLAKATTSSQVLAEQLLFYNP